MEESTSPDQSELEKLLSSDQESELPVEEPAQPKAPARDELEKLLASDESKNFWEDTKKLFESIPQSVEVREEPPEQYYSYKAKAPRPAPARPAPKQTTASGHQRGWPSVNPTAIPAGAKVQRVWIWQESGDCLWNIAKEYYGDPHLWPKIYEANRHLIKNPNIIFPKQQLIIPPLDRATRGG